MSIFKMTNIDRKTDIHRQNNMKEISRRSAIKAIGAVAATTAAYATGAAAVTSCTPEGTRPMKMKVLLINGSPRLRGNTNRMLEEVSSRLREHGIESEILQLGAAPVRGCIACGQCAGKGRCVFDDDICNSAISRMEQSDAVIVGSPVYYGVPNGPVLSLLQRMAYAGGAYMQGKPASAVTVCRRGGATASFQTLQMPFQMLNMPIVTSQYWNIGYGMSEGEVEKDAEGLQTMRTLADNMAYMLKQFRSGSAETPRRERGEHTNFIR